MYSCFPAEAVIRPSSGEPRAGSSRFTEKVENYLTARFDLGEQTGRKADPQQVSNDMRKTTDEQNNRLFDRKEWLAKTQELGFFSRLAASRRRQQDPAEVVLNSRYLLREEEEADRQYLIEEVAPQASQTHDSRNRSNIYDLSTRIE